MRFEVFKRDSFRCQYCGRSAPDVILEVDHLPPVSAGGENIMVNLITSCRDCNRGKGKVLLNDATAVRKQKAELDLLNERREQVEMMAKWRTELLRIEETELDMISDMFDCHTGYKLSDVGRSIVRRAINEFGFTEVNEAASIAIRQYCTSAFGSKRMAYQTADAVNKIGGICANRKRGKFNGYKEDC